MSRASAASARSVFPSSLNGVDPPPSFAGARAHSHRGVRDRDRLVLSLGGILLSLVEDVATAAGYPAWARLFLRSSAS